MIDIWSDIVCPFCYIGKRNLEIALSRFPGRDNVRLHWRSFELDPYGDRLPGENAYNRLARKYGQSLEWAKKASARTAGLAKDIGLTIDYDRIIPAGTFDAHRLVHLADKHSLQEQAEERLMKAYFTEGRDLNDRAVLEELGRDIGLDSAHVHKMLHSDAYADAVRRDEEAAMELKISGVPFFLFNGEVPMSGAQPPEVFLDLLTSVL